MILPLNCYKNLFNVLQNTIDTVYDLTQYFFYSMLYDNTRIYVALSIYHKARLLFRYKIEYIEILSFEFLMYLSDILF